MCKTRKCPAVTVGVFAILTILLGIAMIVLSIRFATSGFSKDVQALGNYNNQAFLMLLAGAIIAVVTGTCGIYLWLKPTRIWCNMIVGLFFLVAFVLLSVNGIAIAFVSHTNPETLQTFCQEPTGSQNYVVSALRTVVTEVDNSIVGVASQ
jgi:Ca2+/Na+ antiporter